MEKIKIKESVVVEGRDDEAAVKAAADCDIICTHGYGITKETLTLIKTAYEKKRHHNFYRSRSCGPVDQE